MFFSQDTGKQQLLYLPQNPIGAYFPMPEQMYLLYHISLKKSTETCLEKSK